MRIAVHDYSGHPFQVQLSRALAGRGHRVRHYYCGSFQTPRGSLEKRPDDPDTFDIRSVSLSQRIHKYSFLKRRAQDIDYGRRLAREIQEFAPDAVVSSNSPLDAQVELQRTVRLIGAHFLFWLQDVYSLGIQKAVLSRLSVLGWPVAWYYRRLEQKLLARSDSVVAITDDFLEQIHWDSSPAQPVAVIPNWAPLNEVPVLPKDNEWARTYGLEDQKVVLYSGTLGLKHNPHMLLELATAYRDDPSVRVVVISEGPGAEWLQERKSELGLDGLMVLGFQPFDVLPKALAAADVLVAILEKDAGVFSVPSKVLTYLCAGRPLLLSVPRENLSARIVADNRAGAVVDPGDTAAFIRECRRLTSRPEDRREAAQNARAYAEETFDIAAITDRFERIISESDRAEPVGHGSA